MFKIILFLVLAATVLGAPDTTVDLPHPNEQNMVKNLLDSADEVAGNKNATTKDSMTTVPTLPPIDSTKHTEQTVKGSTNASVVTPQKPAGNNNGTTDDKNTVPTLLPIGVDGVANLTESNQSTVTMTVKSSTDATVVAPEKVAGNNNATTDDSMITVPTLPPSDSTKHTEQTVKASTDATVLAPENTNNADDQSSLPAVATSTTAAEYSTTGGVDDSTSSASIAISVAILAIVGAAF